VEHVTVTTFVVRETALIEQPWLGAARAEVGPAFNTAMPQPFLKSRAFASVRVALPEGIVPVVGGST
jgi:hypothetical protein